MLDIVRALRYMRKYPPPSGLVTPDRAHFTASEICSFKCEGRVHLILTIAGIEVFYEDELLHAREARLKSGSPTSAVIETIEQARLMFDAVFHSPIPEYAVAADHLRDFHSNNPNALSDALQEVIDSAPDSFWVFAGLRVVLAKYRKSDREALFDAARAWRNRNEWIEDFEDAIVH